MEIKKKFKNILNRVKKNFGWKSALYLGIAVALVLTDLLTKVYEERDGWNFVVIPGLIEVYGGIRNPGMAFSFLAEAEWGQAFLISFTFIMLFALAAAILLLPERFTLLKLSLYIIAAGAIGNLIDRISYSEVRDFIWLSIVNAYCNFADIFIVVGCILALADLLFLNEWAILPLTRTARKAQEEKKNREECKTEDSNTQNQAAKKDLSGSDDEQSSNSDYCGGEGKDE